MTRVMILGGDGMLGHKVFMHLARRGVDAICTLRGAPRTGPLAKVPLFDGPNVLSGVDAMDLASLERLLGEHRPDVVVNCVGIVKQRDAARDALPSVKINALLPHELAGWLSGWGGRLIHFSTDCVFSGRKATAYDEADSSDAEDLYGRTKHLGEVATTNALTIRTSIIGRELKTFASLVEWFLSRRGAAIRGFDGHVYSGLTTHRLAHVVGDLIDEHPTLHGLYQVASEPITKYTLLRLLNEAVDAKVEITRDCTSRVNRALSGQAFARDTGIVVPPWPDMIAELAQDETPYEDWR